MRLDVRCKKIKAARRSDSAHFDAKMLDFGAAAGAVEAVACGVAVLPETGSNSAHSTSSTLYAHIPRLSL